MQSCAVSSSVSLMFQKGSGVENKYLYSDLRLKTHTRARAGTRAYRKCPVRCRGEKVKLQLLT